MVCEGYSYADAGVSQHSEHFNSLWLQINGKYHWCHFAVSNLTLNISKSCLQLAGILKCLSKIAPVEFILDRSRIQSFFIYLVCAQETSSTDDSDEKVREKNICGEEGSLL